MEYILQSSEAFIEQIKELSDDGARIVSDKIRLLKINPFRNKRIKGYGYFYLEFVLKMGEKKRELFTLLINHILN